MTLWSTKMSNLTKIRVLNKEESEKEEMLDIIQEFLKQLNKDK